ncbi:hypothetical protein [Leisingera caerulea]|uniref:hypothetical protein n=1 Tax=Leisingera caerulea TaxID=506591 RepID=UPI00040D42E0|nr:hypothetical protein [Leisingera caerulea]
MKHKDKIIRFLGGIAPTIATALGGPMAGVAVKALAKGLQGNEDASEAAVEEALLNAAPADLVKLKQIEAEFAAQLQEAGIELERIAAGDRASARDRQVKMRDWTPAVLGVLIIAGFFGVLSAIFYLGLPDDGGEVLLIMVGALGAMTSQVGNYFFGSSTGSKEKQQIIAASMTGGAA